MKEFSPNFYANSPLDRADHLRSNEEWIRERENDPSSRFLFIFEDSVLTDCSDTPQPLLLAPEQLIEMGSTHAPVFLGLWQEHAVFALDLLSTPRSLLEGRQMLEIRQLGLRQDPQLASLVAHARGMCIWIRRSHFCSHCGSTTQLKNAGHMRQCVNPDCAVQHFPRIDPAVIMLVHDGRDRVVLGRQANWPEGRYSVLAGFVEPGESLEDAVRREVFEEVGVEVEEVCYHSSQPWPFPASIMLGFVARAKTTELNVNTQEIEHADWFSREQLQQPEQQNMQLARSDSISRRLLDDWLDGAL